MSSGFFTNHGSVIVTNQRFDALISFAVAVGRSIASTQEEASYAERLAAKQVHMYPGYDILVEEQFPIASERRFWAAVFSELAIHLAGETIGNPKPPHAWRKQASAEAESIARLFSNNEA